MTAAVEQGTTLRPRSGGAISPLALLDETERHWSRSPAAELQRPGGSRRRVLIVEALAAYERLRARDAPDSDPGTVFRRWPACTLVSLVELATGLSTAEALHAEVAALDVDPAGWLAGWAQAWASVVHELRELPGTPERALVIASSGAAGPADAAPPRLRLDLDRGALTVMFPGERPRGERVVVAGGDCPRHDECWIVPTPARLATCHDLLGQVHALRIVDIRDPLLVFDEAGELIPPSESLPAQDVWIVHLGEPAEGAVTGRWRLLEYASPPVGWTRWWLAKISLAEASALRSAVDFGDGPRFGPWRPVVGADAEADLDFPTPLPMLRDEDGDAVYGAAPVLRLPGGAEQTWQVELRRQGSLVPRRWTVPGGSVVTLTEQLNSPRAGHFSVHATAPGRRPVRGEFTAAEGVSVQASCQLRVLRQHGGLFPATVRVHTPGKIYADPSTVKLRGDDTQAPIDLHCAGLAQPVRLWVVVPHCTHRIHTGESNERWRTTPHRLSLQQLSGGACLDVRLPAGLVEALPHIPELVAGAPDDQEALRIRGLRIPGSARATDDQVVRYRLATLLDSLPDDRSLSLQLDLPGQPAVVAELPAVTPVAGVTLAGRRLRLQDRRPDAELDVVVRSPTAPWIPPQRMTLGASDVELTLEPPLDNGTIVDVAICEASGRRPRAFRVGDAAIAPAPASEIERQMCRYLARRGPLPDTPAALSLYWWGAADNGLARDEGLRRLIAQECAARLASNPIAALQAGATTGLPPSQLMASLVRSGLAAARLQTVAEPASVGPIWAKSPLLALLATSPLLPYLSGSRDWDLAELEPDEAAVLTAAKEVLDPAALALLAGDLARTEPLPAAALLGGTLWTTPTPTAAMLENLRLFAETSLYSEFVAIAGAAPHPVSLSMALVARLAAQGDRTAIEFERGARLAWLDVIAADPGAAAGDLVRAELLVSAAVACGYERHV